MMCEKCKAEYGKITNSSQYNCYDCYDNVKKELIKYKAAYEVLKEANQCYAIEANWLDTHKQGTERPDMRKIVRGDRDANGFGGKKAREAAKKAEEILK